MTQKSLVRAAKKLSDMHEQERLLCLKYKEACEDAEDWQGAKDFMRLVREHADARARYAQMCWRFKMCKLDFVCCNLDIVMPTVWYY